MKSLSFLCLNITNITEKVMGFDKYGTDNSRTNKFPFQVTWSRSLSGTFTQYFIASGFLYDVFIQSEIFKCMFYFLVTNILYIYILRCIS